MVGIRAELRHPGSGRATIAVMGRLRLAGLAAAIAVLLTLIPAQAQAARGMEVALQDDQVLVSRIYYDRDKALRDAQKLQVTWIRVNLGWNRAIIPAQQRLRKAPRQVFYDWRPWDNLIEAAAARGIKVQLALTGWAPPFATGNRKAGVVRPSSKHFGRFARDAARHFKGRVTRYSIWNEPNHIGWIKPLRSQAKIYRGLY